MPYIVIGRILHLDKRVHTSYDFAASLMLYQTKTQDRRNMRYAAAEETLLPVAELS